MEEFSFNLVDEPWIACTDLDGNRHTLGLLGLLEQAHEMRGLSYQNPLTEAALFRVLLAVVHRSVNGPQNSSEWKGLYKSGRFDNRIPEYLAQWRHRFELFSPDTPFYQTSGLLVINEKGEPVPQSITSIMLGTASGNNKTLFDHTTADTPIRLSPADAVAALITAQMYSLGGLNRKTTKPFGYQQSFLQAVMVSGIFIILSGRNLFETIMLNLLIYSDNDPIPNPDGNDCPVWERSDIGGTEARVPKGYLDYLTCKCRHILLVPQWRNNQFMIEHIHIAQGEAFPMVPNPGFLSRKNEKENRWYHPQLDVNRLVWRDSSTLFSFEKGEDRRPLAFKQVAGMRASVEIPLRYVCTAIALANQKANPLAWRRESLNVPLSLLTDGYTISRLKDAMSFAEFGADVVRKTAFKYMQVYLPEGSKDVSEKAKATGADRMYWDRMEGQFQIFLRDLEDPDKAVEIWIASIRRVARDSLKLCVHGRYRDSSRSFQAWSVANEYLNLLLVRLAE